MLYYISNKSYWKTGLLGFTTFIIVISLIKFPDISFQSSLRGLTIWWEVVFPALLPFFILSEILMGLGVVHFMSVLLEPLMRPLFNVPGSGAFVMTMGFSSGYPISSKITTRLREQGLVTRSEGERLVAFTTTSDPLFMFGAIAVGFFYNPTLGVIIVIAHYLSAIIVGLLMRNHDVRSTNTPKSMKTKDMILLRALKAMHQARIKDRRPLGKLLGDAVTSSISTLALIGGFIILMSVLISILGALKITNLFVYIAAFVLSLVGFAPELATAFISGIFEVTIGSKEASISTEVTFLQKISIVSVILAWGGLSVHAQIAAILSATDIRYWPFFVSRIFHALIAGVLTLIIWKPSNYLLSHHAIPVFSYSQAPIEFKLWNYWVIMATMSLSILTFMLMISLLIYARQRFINRRFF
ncbi:sporulation integral membrane protein YlbJ [Desulfuribacillus alkaliarsenatis]|uniref:Sporulation integral membrane protein YlbJ n=1 Tax=Desulfuribacillus alkaliarsenatis TaxID=766136 RepID=A0A1E5G5U7_9FIRM|nr:sporulation integral membrane protein YlbJ [Desulfuribacillus alkaliarsenatis]OEF98550.1 sporulation integral membrane protein YlbJ [Desulfuribacillus alkaliarsenatis]